MDQSDIQLQVEKRKAVLDALDQLSEVFNQTLQNLIDEKHLNTEVAPTQLELPLGMTRCSIQDPWLKVSEPCTSPTLFRSSMNKK
jgi:hypothetical protein